MSNLENIIVEKKIFPIASRITSSNFNFYLDCYIHFSNSSIDDMEVKICTFVENTTPLSLPWSLKFF